MALEDQKTVEFNITGNTDNIEAKMKSVNEKLLEAQKYARIDLIVMASKAQDELSEISKKLKNARGDARIDLRIQQADAKKQLAELNTQIKTADKNIKNLEKSGKSAQNTFSKMGKSGKSSLLEWFAGLSIIEKGYRLLKKAFNFAVQFKNAQRDAIETKNKFGEIYKTIRVEAEKTAQSVAQNFGLANTTAREMLGSTGDFLKGLQLSEEQSLAWSKRVIEMSGDLTSFKNVQGGIPRTMEAVSKAMLGQTRMLKDAIQTSIDKKEIDEKAQEVMKEQTDLTYKQAKAYAVLELITERNKDAVGDFARTRQDLANKERELEERYKSISETLGKGIIPAFDSMIDVQNAFLDVAFGDALDRITQSAQKQMGAFDDLSYRLQVLSANQNRSKVEQQEFERVLGTLQTQYQEYLSLLSAEKSSHEEIAEALKLQREYQQDRIFENVLNEKNKLFKQQELELAMQKISVEQEALRITNLLKDRNRDVYTSAQGVVDAQDEIADLKAEALSLDEDIKEKQAEQLLNAQLHEKAVEEINKKHRERLELLKREKKLREEQAKADEEAKRLAFLNSEYYILAQRLTNTADSMQKIKTAYTKLLHEYDNGKITEEEFITRAKALELRTKSLEEATKKAAAAERSKVIAMRDAVEQGSILWLSINELVKQYDKGILSMDMFISKLKELKEEQSKPVGRPDEEDVTGEEFENIIEAYQQKGRFVESEEMKNLKLQKQLYDYALKYEKERYDLGLQSEKEFLNKKTELRKEFNQKEDEETKKKNTDLLSVLDNSQSAFFNIAKLWANKDLARIDSKYTEEENRLAEKYENDEISREEYDNEMKKLDLKAEKEKRAILIRQQKWDVASAVANSAVAVTKVFATTPPPYSFVLAGLTALKTALEVQTILAQKFEQGGIAKEGGISQGLSHAEGGIKGVVGSSRTPIEFEGGEPILKKEAGQFRPTRDLANYINTFHNGAEFPNTRKVKSVSMHYADGSIYRLGNVKRPARSISNFFQDGGIAGDINLNGQENPTSVGVSVADLNYIASKLSVNASAEAQIDMDKIAFAVTVRQNKMENNGTELKQVG